MPVIPTYPGVYVEEIPSGVRTIMSASTSITAFVGRALMGPVENPVMIHSYADYERIFGGLWYESTMSYAVQHYFQNGGKDALIVRLIADDAATASFNLGTTPLGEAPPEGSPNLVIEAKNAGAWGTNLRIKIDSITKDPETLFNLTAFLVNPSKPNSEPLISETYRNLSMNYTNSRFISNILSQESSLIQIKSIPTDAKLKIVSETKSPDVSGSDGRNLTSINYEGSETNKKGIYALEKASIFNLLCIPPFSRSGNSDKDDVAKSTWDKAYAYCERRRAFLIVDAPSTWKDMTSVKDASTVITRNQYSALYFPRLKMPDPLMDNGILEFAPCGVVAGIYARTDANRGIWKAPAGIDTAMNGVKELTFNMTDRENGDLNPQAINCLRSFPVYGNVVWGARTLYGADALASEWKYIPIRRLALFIEESLYRGTQWVVFEPNDEPLWSQIRMNVGAFMHNLYRQGAFQGQSAREAYFVKCDKETTDQNDINSGRVNILVGFAPLKPAEFVIIKIQQMAGNIKA